MLDPRIIFSGVGDPSVLRSLDPRFDFDFDLDEREHSKADTGEIERDSYIGAIHAPVRVSVGCTERGSDR